MFNKICKFRRQRIGEVENFAACRVAQRQRRTVKRLTRKHKFFQVCRGEIFCFLLEKEQFVHAVKFVSGDRISQRTARCPDLVGAPGAENGSDQRKVFARFFR